VLASLAAFLTVLIGVGGCSGNGSGTAPDATTTSSGAASSPAPTTSATAAPLPLIGRAKIDNTSYQLRLYRLPKKVDATVWNTIESTLAGTGKDVITVVDIEQATSDGSVMPTPAVASRIVGNRDRLAVLTQPVQVKDPPDNPLGNVGSLIFALARYRISDHATSQAALGALARKTPVCGADCERLAKDANALTAGFYPLTWRPFADALGTTSAGAETSPSPTTASPPDPAHANPPPAHHESRRWLPWTIVGVLAAILLAVGVLALRRPRRDRFDHDIPVERTALPRTSGQRAGTEPARDAQESWAPPPAQGAQQGRQRTGGVPSSARPALHVARVHAPDVELGQRGLVHSEFRETGYVAAHGALYRAVWKGSGQSRPRIGESVALYTDSGDGLQAWPVGPPDGRRRRASDQ